MDSLVSFKSSASYPPPSSEPPLIPCSLFAGFSPLLRAEVCSLRYHYTLEADYTLFSEGARAHGVYIVNGPIELHMNGKNGRRLCLHHAEAGSVLGLQAMLAESVYECTAITRRRCQVDFLAPGRFESLLTHWPQFALTVCRVIAQQTLALERQVREVLLEGSTESRLAHLLLHEAQSRFLTHEALSQRIGCARESVSRVLRDWHREGIVSPQVRPVAGVHVRGLAVLRRDLLEGKLA